MSIKSRFLLTGLAMTLLHSASAAAQTTEIVVDYPIPDMFKPVHEKIAHDFMEKYPQYKVRFLAPTPDYEAATQQSLRQAVTGQLSDVSFQGLNRQRIFADRGIAVDLEPFIAQEKNWSQMGYDPALLSLGQVNGKQVGIGFSLSTPIIYYNADLVRKAGGDPDKFPTTWDGIFALSRKIEATTANTHGFHFDWDITGNWMWQALVFSYGGSMLDASEKTVAFNQAPGQAAIQTLANMVTEGTMRNVNSKISLQDFLSGNLGIWSHSTSRLGGVMKQVGSRFEVRTAPFPISSPQGRLPAGGNAVMMFTKDPAKQKAVWEYIKFATGPIGSTIMVKETGYFPANTLPVNDPALLKPFYEANPNHMTAIKQLTLLTGWYAFPGENGLKITDVIKDHLQTVVAKSTPAKTALDNMATDVQALLPQ
ncbi:ABC transporter substrate-binding protein [Serratia sp. DD3]|uniref:ABC transporter substrate-binding protein n=1 Tax=Serratia sp. DD3 TaxID=1410619 RepID=UPI0003C51B0E|nr:ABC transporter substrate-binding protein [Serratia sp. DD3]KEY57920.1 sn-glycerol-3-phosphate-binding periplasmic protein UgpB [Serratia sp. DD3]